jgi:hypothetical protein
MDFSDLLFYGFAVSWYLILYFICFRPAANKAGYSAWSTILFMLIPFIVVWIAAFQKWPVENEASVQPD